MDNYDTHMIKVDRILDRRTGLSHQDGPDTDTWSRWDAGMTPAQHAEAILDEWGWEA